LQQIEIGTLFAQQ